MRKKNEIFLKICIAIFCVGLVVLELVPIAYVADAKRNVWIAGIVKNAVGFIATVLLLRLLGARVFGRIRALGYIIPCLIVAIDNFPFYSFFQGNMSFARTDGLDCFLFALYCMAVGLFEEGVFRGVIFTVFASVFSKDKKGLIKSWMLSSFVFGFAHLFNLFVGANVGETLLQVVYTTLTGGLFAFAFIKTKNLLVPAFVHGVYNFCGLLLSKQGLGTGVVFDLGTGVIMAIVSVCVGLFVLYSLYKYTESERKELYGVLGVQE